MAMSESLKMNDLVIMKDMMEAIEAFKAGDYAKAGELLGEILKMIAGQDSKTLMGVDDDKLTKNVGLMTQGFLKATHVGEFNLVDLLLCIGDVDIVAESALNMVTQIEDGVKTKNLSEIVNGLLDVINIVAAMKLEPATCANVFQGANWGDYNNIVNTLENPEKAMVAIGKSIVMNGKVITDEINSTVEAYRAGEWSEFGRNFGVTMIDTCSTDVNDLFLY
jgi:hypothetical protein